MTKFLNKFLVVGHVFGGGRELGVGFDDLVDSITKVFLCSNLGIKRVSKLVLKEVEKELILIYTKSGKRMKEVCMERLEYSLEAKN